MRPSVRHVFRLSTFAAAALLLSLPLLSRPGAGSRTPQVAGITIIASDVGTSRSVEDLLAFVDAARIGHVIIDWAWITLHWDGTDFDSVEELVRSLKAKGVRVAAMYRPRFKEFQIADHDVAFQVDEKGHPHAGFCEILYADGAARRWGTDWAVRIMTRCPSIDEVVIYNPTQRCRSRSSLSARRKDPEFDHKCVRAFLVETRRAMRKVRTDARLGLVLPPRKALYDRYCPYIDVARPFLFLREGADFEADWRDAMEVLEGNDGAGPPLAKIAWGDEEPVSDERLAAFIAIAREKKQPFVFWTFSAAFCEGRNDLRKLCISLGLDADRITPLIRDLGGKTGIGWNPETVRKAVRAAADDVSDEYYRKMLAVADRYGADAVEPLCALLDDVGEPEHVRWRAAGALGRTGSKAALPILLKNSRDGSAMVRLLCAQALATCGTGSAEAIARLREMAATDPFHAVFARREGPVYQVRERALMSLESLALEAVTDRPLQDELPWVDTIEEALERARAEKRLVVLLINPFDREESEAGWKNAGGKKEKKRKEAGPFGQEDVGFLKERAMTIGMLAEPRTIALLRDRGLLVRMRLCTLKFSPIYADTGVNPLERVGLNPIDIGAPSIVVCAPSGEVVARASHLAFFCPELMDSICGEALASAGLPPTEAVRAARDALAEKAMRARYQAFLEALLDAGEGGALRRAIADWPFSATRGATVLALAEADLLAGRTEAALESLEDHRPARDGRTRHAALLAEARFRRGDAPGALRAIDRIPRDDPAWGARLAFFEALALERTGRTAEARERFIDLAVTDERGPWGARAALHFADDGPNPREWCPFDDLDLPAIVRSTEKGANGMVVRGIGAAGLPAAIRRGARYLLDRQRPDGSWGGSRMVSLPAGLSTGDSSLVPRTALCVCALDEALPFLDRHLGERAGEAIARGRAVVHSFGESPGDNIWDVTYALHMEMCFFARLKAGERKAAAKRIGAIVKAIAGLEHDGGWTYYSSERLHTFNTAPIMLALSRVKEQDLADVDGMLQRGAAFLEGQRLGDASLFHYGSKMDHLTSMKQPQGSSMRSPLCELALLESGAGDGVRLTEGLELFFRHLDDVRSTAKKWESHFEPSVLHDAYHYFFGTWYGAQAIGRLEDAASRRRMAERLAEAVLQTEELDGGYVDAQIHSGRNSSTAMALLTLAACGRQIR